MQIPRNILESNIYNSVMELSKLKGIKVSFHLIEEENPDCEVGLGFTNYTGNEITVGIRYDALEMVEVFIHELLHAKQFLLGYPKVESYSQIPLHPYIETCLVSLSNTVHHSFVFKEMKSHNFNQAKIDHQFITGVLDEIDNDFSGLKNLAFSVNLLECYFRDSRKIYQLAEKKDWNQKEKFSLFFQLKNALRNLETPYKMREGLANSLKIINQFIKNIHKEELHLNILISVSPVFMDNQLEKKASENLFTIKIKGYPHVFVLDKTFNQTCMYLSRGGNDLSKQDVDWLLNNHTLKEFLKMF